jgi:hypothetical protein
MTKEDSASPHRHGQTGIVAAGQHQAEEQLFDSIDLSFFDVGGCSSDTLLKRANGDFFLFQPKRVPIGEIEDNDAGHNFGERGYFD